MAKKKKKGGEGGKEGEGKSRLIFINKEPWAGANFSYRPGARLIVGPPEHQGAELTEECARAREEAGLGTVEEEELEDDETDETKE